MPSCGNGISLFNLYKTRLEKSCDKLVIQFTTDPQRINRGSIVTYALIQFCLKSYI